MGEVYLAEHVLLRRPCAVKLIRPEQTTDVSVLQRFEREVQAMATLTHWNTVEVYDYGRADDGTFYYAMEYLPGLNLETLVARHGPLPSLGDRGMEMLVAHAYEEVVPPRDVRPSVPADLQAVILRCLSKKRDDRYGSAEELEKALAACAAAERWSEEQAAAWWRAV